MAKKEDDLREYRNLLLSKSDWTQLPDVSLTDQQKVSWAAYRQKLRDVPQNTIDVKNPVWPAKPGQS